MTSETTLAYLAGLIDGEGYIGIKKTRTAKGRVAPGYHARIQVRMVHEPAIALLAQELGGRYYREGAATGLRRDLYCWQASDAIAEKILRALLPYLRVKRHHAEAVLRLRKWQSGGSMHRTKLLGYREFQGFRGGVRRVRTMGFSDAYIASCESAYLECKSLNH